MNIVRLIRPALIAVAGGCVLYPAQAGFPRGARSVDCVTIVDATCIRKGAVQTMVWPTPLPNIENPRGLPVGYVERTITLDPGDISADAAALAQEFGGWARHTCTYGTGATVSPRCTDGRFVSSVRATNCSGVYEKKVYTIIQDTRICDTSGETATGFCTGDIVVQSYRSCAVPGSSIAYLIKDTGAASTAPRNLTDAQIDAFKVGADRVSGDGATIAALCSAYGATAAYSSTTGRFSSCSDNTLAVYRSGTWTRLNACSAGNTVLTSLICAFPN